MIFQKVLTGQSKACLVEFRWLGIPSHNQPLYVQTKDPAARLIPGPVTGMAVILRYLEKDKRQLDRQPL